MRTLEKHEKKSKFKISKISKLFRKLFICQQKKNKKKAKRYISYATIEIKCPTNVKSKYVKDKSQTEPLPEPESKTKNPESATVSSQNNLSSLVTALRQFKLTTAVSRYNLLKLLYVL